jgi:hypothetical protein
MAARRLALTLVPLLLACKTDDGSSLYTASSSGIETAAEEAESPEGSEQEAESNSGDGDGDGEGSTGPKLDTLPQESADDGPNEAGCEKADFLFVIDNSGSMADEQQNLINSFPEFIGTIQDTLMAQDYRVMVVDTDASGGGGYSISCTNGECSCTPVPACCEMVCQFNATCNGFPCNMLPGGECDGTLGAGKVFDQDGNSCLPEDGPRFITDQDDLATAFSCAGNVGTYGNGAEEPAHAMVEATGDALNAAGACNEGFIRDDAILVVTIITDEEDIMKSPGTPATWYQHLVDVKNGNPDAVVVLGLIGDNDLPNAQCPPFDPDQGQGAEPSPNLRSFVQMFGDKGVLGSVCAPNYGPFFVDAVSVIDVTCDEFEPVG